jgi:hypothetical protein
MGEIKNLFTLGLMAQATTLVDVKIPKDGPSNSLHS